MTDLILMGKPSENHLSGRQKETDRNRMEQPRRTRTVPHNRSRNRKAACQDLLRCAETGGTHRDHTFRRKGTEDRQGL